MADEDDPIPPGRGRVRIEAIDALGQPAGVWSGVIGLDGHTVGGTYSGTYLEDIAPGTYRAEIHHPQHDSLDITVNAGAITVVRSRPRGRIRVEAIDALGQPASAWHGVLDEAGHSLGGAYSGDAIVDVLPGTYRAEIHHPQHDAFEVTVAAGGVETRRSRPRGRIVVRAIAALGEDASCWHGVIGTDGASLGGAYGGNAIVDVLPGTYLAQIHHPQHDEFTVTVAAGATEERRSRPRGRITVDAIGALGDETGVWQGVVDLEGKSLGGSYGSPAIVDVLPGAYHAQIHHPQHDEFDVTVAAGSLEHRQSRPRGRIIASAIDVLGQPAACWHGVMTVDGVSLGGSYGAPAQVDVLPGTYDVVASFDPQVKRRVEVVANATRAETLAPSRVTRLEIGMPGHEIASGDMYSVSADPPDGADPRPQAAIRIAAFSSDQPSSDGTRIRIAIRSEGTTESRAALLVRGESCSGEATTVGGVVEGVIRCGPSTIGTVELPAAPAARWRVDNDNIEYLDPAVFVVEASADDAEPATIRFQIEPGKPARLELVLPSAVPPGSLPEGIAEVGGNVLEVSNVTYDYKRLSIVPVPPVQQVYRSSIPFRIGGWVRASAAGAHEEPTDLDAVGADGSDREALPGGIHNILGSVTDAAGNPCPISANGGDGTRVTLGFPQWKSWGSVSHPFVLAEPVTKAIDANGNVWRCNAQHPLPDNLFFIQFVPSFGLTTAVTDLQFRIADASTVYGDWRYRFTDRPSSKAERALYWFASGDPQDGWQYLGELVIGFIPLLGDGRDLLIYGMKHINGEKLGVLDHCMAALSLAGLVLDLLPGNPMDVAAASAKSAIKELKRIPSGPAEALGKAIGDELAKGLPRVDNAGDWKKLADKVDFTALAGSVKELGKLGDAIRRLDDIKKARKLLTVLGLALAAVQLRTLLYIAGKFGYEVVVDLLEGLEELEKP